MNVIKGYYLFILFALVINVSWAQSALNNNGSLTLFISDGLVVHADDDVSNMNTSTLVFESAGEPNLEFDGHFTNSTSATITAGTGLLELTGSASQNLDFGGDDLYNLEIVNAAGGVFTRTATVNNEVQFNIGDFITTDSELLIFETTASTAGASDNSHTNGPVAKNFNSTSAFVFPVGHGSSYNSLAYKPDGTGATTMKAKFNYVKPSNRTSLGAGICKVSNVEYWDFTRTSGSEDGVVTLEWDADSYVSDLSDLVVAYWDGALWQNGAGVAVGAPGSGTIPSGSSMTNFITYTLGSKTCINALPVELLKFDAVKQSNYVDVLWATGAEINNDYFAVQKSIDGIKWETIGTVGGAGNSSSPIDYSYQDYNLCSNTCYYRIQQFDYDGSSERSRAVQISYEEDINLDLTVYPNPVLSNLNVAFEAPVTGAYNVNVFSVDGQSIYTAKVVCAEGENNFQIKVGQLIPGLYFITMTDMRGSEIGNERFTKK